MNIFKILASGDGTLNEPNVSAFLGYLLDPKGDHGINSRFLEAFLLPLVKRYPEKLGELRKQTISLSKETEVTDLSSFSFFDVQVYYEKAMGEATDIVDIIIKISKKPIHRQDANSIFEDYTPLCLILIENKIRKDSMTTEQVQRQSQALQKRLGEKATKLVSTKEETLKNTRDLEIYKQNCFSVYVTPFVDEVKKSKKKNFVENFDNINGLHLFWTSKDHEQNSIEKMINDLLEKERTSQIDPIYDYTKHTLRSFANFISVGFRSQIQEATEFKSFNEWLHFSKLTSELKNKISKTHQEILSIISNADLQENIIIRYLRNRVSYFIQNKKNLILTINVDSPSKIRLLHHNIHFDNDFIVNVDTDITPQILEIFRGGLNIANTNK